MARRGYSNVAINVALVGTLDAVSSSNTITVSPTPAGYPSAPFFIVIDQSTATEEVAYCTALTGTTMTITRGSAMSATFGSTTRAHANGAVIKHVSVGADFDEANAHVNTAGAVHGLTGSIVGTSDVQTLTNKTLGAGTVLPATVVDTTTAQTLTNKTLTGPTINSPVVQSSAVGTPSSQVKAIASQTSNLDEWQNAAGAALSYVNVTGGIFDNGQRVYSVSNPPPASTALNVLGGVSGTPAIASSSTGGVPMDLSTPAPFTFIAPSSGRVKVTISVSIVAPNTSQTREQYGYRLSGPTTVAFANANSAYTSNSSYQNTSFSVTNEVGGLTAGGTYTFTGQYLAASTQAAGYTDGSIPGIAYTVEG